MVVMRDPSLNGDPPPDYAKNSGLITLSIHYGGSVTNTGYVGGKIYKFDHVEYNYVGLGSLDHFAMYVGIRRDKTFYLKEENLLKQITSTSTLQEIIDKFQPLREVDIYINGKIEAEEGDESEGDEVVGGLNEYKSSSGGEEFDDSDSEYEYKMNEDQDEIEDVAAENDDWDFKVEEELVDNVIKDANEGKKSEARDEEIQVEGVRVDETDLDNWSGEENLLWSEDELNSNKGSNVDEKGETFPVFNPSCIFDPQFALGMIFSTKKEFRSAVQSYAIKTKRNIKFAKNDKKYVHAKCFDKNCKWRIHACKVNGECTFQIRDYVPQHTCNISFNVRNMKSSWLSKKYFHKFKSDPKRTVKGFRIDAIEDVRCNISTNQAARAQKLAMLMLHGNPAQQFALLWDYADEVKRSNPGSTVILGTEQNMFDRFYVCLHALRMNFLAGCRPVLCVDGCHLKGPHGGVLLAAVGIDPNNNFFPLCYAVVMKENREIWGWFLTLLKRDLHIENDSTYTFMSDKQKGLVGALQEVFPNAEHRFCVRHLHSNFKSNGFRGLAFKNGLWKAARATTVNQFNERMKELNELDEGAYAWFNDKPPKEWSRSHFSPHPRCDILLNNACECFNSNILEAREKPILTMLEWLMEYLMKRVQQNRDRALKRWKRVLCPKIQKIIDKNIEKLGDCIPIKSDDKHYQISCFDGTQYSVDLLNGTCGCRKWDLSGIPCKHVVSAILCQGEDIEKYTHQCYRVETYLKAYHHPILPINGRDEWKKSDFNPPVPPKAVKRVGRPPKSSRRLEVDEPVNKKKKRRGAPILKEGSSRIKRQQTTVKCGKCGQQGHNARGCATKTAPSEPVPDASSQVPPKEQPQKIQVRRKGKAIMHEPEVVLHKRTRSGNIPAAAPVIRKLQNIKPTKSFATAPSMFQQFQQCHKGVKIKEPANFVDAEVGGRSLDEQGSSGSTPSIVKGGRKFVTMSNLSNAISELNKGKKKA